PGAAGGRVELVGEDGAVSVKAEAGIADDVADGLAAGQTNLPRMHADVELALRITADRGAGLDIGNRGDQFNLEGWVINDGWKGYRRGLPQHWKRDSKEDGKGSGEHWDGSFLSTYQRQIRLNPCTVRRRTRPCGSEATGRPRGQGGEQREKNGRPTEKFPCLSNPNGTPSE